MFRAPTWRMSEYLTIISSWLMSMTSDTSFRLWRSAAPRSIRSPSSPSPWKLYGELRGLKAPPRSTFAPARFTAAAAASTCCSFSAEQGPAMTITSSPPIRTSPTEMTLFSGLNVRLASLYGSVMRTTSCTPSSTSRSLGSRCAPATDRANHRAQRAARPVHIESHLDQLRDHPLHLFVRRPFLHDHNHNDLRFTSECFDEFPVSSRHCSSA